MTRYRAWCEVEVLVEVDDENGEAKVVKAEASGDIRRPFDGLEWEDELGDKPFVYDGDKGGWSMPEDELDELQERLEKAFDDANWCNPSVICDEDAKVGPA